MIKQYFSVRVFVILDICLLATLAIAFYAGWSVIKAFPVADAVTFALLILPLAGIGVKSVFQRSQLMHRKHEHIQYINEQQEEYRIEELRSHLPLPLSSLSQVKEEHMGQVSQGSGTNGTAIPSVPLSQSVPTKMPTTPDDFNVSVAYYLSQYPQASIREVERATGIPKSNIGRTPAWQNRGH